MRFKEIFIALIFFILVAALFFNKTILFGYMPFPGDLLIAEYKPWSTYSYLGYVPGSFPNKAQYFDTIRQIYPWETLTIDIIRKGQIPFWNPYNFAGSPLLANFQSAVFYPFSLFYLVFSQITAWTILIILQTILAGFFTYLFARTIGIGRIGSLIGATAFSYSLFMTVFLEYNTIGHAILFLPLSLYLVEKLLEKITVLRAVLFAASIAFTFLAGHLQIAGFSLVFIFVYLLFRARKVHILTPLTLLILFGLGASAVQLFPTFELISLSARSSQNYTFLIEKLLLQPQQLILLFSPDFFGNPATRNYLIPDTYPGNAVYIGLVPLIFTLFAFVSFKKNSFVRFFMIFSVVLLFFLTRSPITELFYRFEIPLFSTGSPTNAIFLLAFSLSILSGFGLDRWLSKTDKFDKRVLSFVWGLFLIIWIILLTLNWQIISKNNLIYSTGVLAVFTVLVISSKFFTKKKFIIALILLVITIFDLFYFFQKFNPFVPKESVFPNASIFTYLQEQAGIDRFWGYGGAAIEANFATAYKLFSPDGYDPLYPKRYGEFIQASKHGKITTDFTNQTRSDAVIVPGFGEMDLASNAYRLKILDLLGVKYILDRVENGSTEKTFPQDRFKLVYEQDGWRIFVNLKVTPRAFLTTNYQTFRTKEEFGELFFSKEFNPREIVLLEEEPELSLNVSKHLSEIKVVSYAPNEVRLITNTDGDQLLFISDTYYPGWKAFVDRQETKIYRANYAFRSIVVPKGEHTTEFRYEPESFSLGMKTTIISVALVIFFSFYLGRKKHA